MNWLGVIPPSFLYSPSGITSPQEVCVMKDSNSDTTPLVKPDSFSFEQNPENVSKLKCFAESAFNRIETFLNTFLHLHSFEAKTCYSKTGTEANNSGRTLNSMHLSSWWNHLKMTIWSSLRSSSDGHEGYDELNLLKSHNVLFLQGFVGSQKTSKQLPDAC